MDFDLNAASGSKEGVWKWQLLRIAIEICVNLVRLFIENI